MTEEINRGGKGSLRYPVYTEIFNIDLHANKCDDNCFTFVDVELKGKKHHNLVKLSVPHFDGDKCNRKWSFEFVAINITPIYVYNCKADLPKCGDVTIMTPNKCIEKLCVGLGHTLWVDAPRDVLVLNVEVKYRWKIFKGCKSCCECPESIYLSNCPTKVPCPPKCGWDNWDPYGGGSHGGHGGDYSNPWNGNNNSDGSWGGNHGGGCQSCGNN